MDMIFYNIIILPMLNYFNYFKAIFHCSKVFIPTLFTAIYGYSRLFKIIIIYFTLGFFLILNYFILSYFRLCEIIVGYFWLLKIISLYVSITYYRLYYHRIFMVIPLVLVYSINGYWWLLYYKLLLII
jgi:hypothetical protein